MTLVSTAKYHRNL